MNYAQTNPNIDIDIKKTCEYLDKWDNDDDDKVKLIQLIEEFNNIHLGGIKNVENVTNKDKDVRDQDNKHVENGNGNGGHDKFTQQGDKKNYF